MTWIGDRLKKSEQGFGCGEGLGFSDSDAFHADMAGIR